MTGNVNFSFVNFWMRYVWPNLAPLELEKVDEVWSGRIAPDFHRYVSTHCERFVGALIGRPNVRDWLGFEVATMGRYWDAEAEIDVVALDQERRHALIVEVKWSSNAVGEDIANNLRTKAEACPAFSSMKKQYLLVSRSGFTANLTRKALPDLLLMDLRKTGFE